MSSEIPLPSILEETDAASIPAIDEEMRDPILMPELRGAKIPERYLSSRVKSYHDTHLETEVKYEGKPLGFTVGQVFVERRWCIGADGELLVGAQWETAYKQIWYLPQYTPRGRASIDHNLIPIPNPKEYVAKKMDPSVSDRTESMIPMDMRTEPPAPPPAAEVPVQETKSAGGGGKEVVRRHLYDQAQRGLLSAEQLAEELMRLDGVTPIAAAKGDSTGAPSGEGSSEPESPVDPSLQQDPNWAVRTESVAEGRPLLAECGVDLGSPESRMRGITKARHARNCPKCAEIKAGSRTREEHRA